MCTQTAWYMKNPLLGDQTITKYEKRLIAKSATNLWNRTTQNLLLRAVAKRWSGIGDSASGVLKMYVVIANRWNDPERHSYLVGVFDNAYSAYRAAVTEEYWRSGKYTCEVREKEVNEYDSLKENWCKKSCLPDEEYDRVVEARAEEHLRLHGNPEIRAQNY